MGNVQKTWECTKNLLNISMIVQRSTIPPLREVRESGVCEGGCNEFYGDVKKTWGCNGAM